MPGATLCTCTSLCAASSLWTARSSSALREALVRAWHSRWLSFVRFTRTKRLHRGSLAQAWLRHEAIILPVKFASYDILIPIYCGDLGQPHIPEAYPYLAVQIKAQKRSTSPHLPDLTIPDLKLAHPPLYCWIDMRRTSNTATPSTNQPAPSAPSERMTVAICRDSRRSITAFRLSACSFEPGNHPALCAALGEYDAASCLSSGARLKMARHSPMFSAKIQHSHWSRMVAQSYVVSDNFVFQIDMLDL